MTTRKFPYSGLMAINPSALGMEPEGPPGTGSTTPNTVAIRGPLFAKSNPFSNPWGLDTYESIVSRIEAACQSTKGPAIGLVIDSPGGVCSGLFDACRQARAIADKYGKKLHAYVEGQACSAAYAWAVTCDSITVGITSVTGSIGVIDVRPDISAMNEAQGIRVAYITSGKTKAYGAMNLALTDEELADRQRVVDDLAAVFFAYVQERRGIDARPLEARVYVGQSAITVGLADQQTSYATWLSGLGATVMTFDEIVSALEELAKGDGEDADQAKKALDTMKDQPAEDAPADAEDKNEEPEAEDKNEEPEASSTMAQMAAQMAELSAQVRTLTADKEASEKSAFLASRPDLGKELTAILADKPLAEVKAIVNAVPKKQAARAATVTVPATQGDPKAAASAAPASDLARIDAAMGVHATSSTGTHRTESTLVLGAPKEIK